MSPYTINAAIVGICLGYILSAFIIIYNKYLEHKKFRKKISKSLEREAEILREIVRDNSLPYSFIIEQKIKSENNREILNEYESMRTCVYWSKNTARNEKGEYILKCAVNPYSPCLECSDWKKL